MSAAGGPVRGPLATGREGARVTSSLTREMVGGALRGLRPPRERVWRSVRITACVLAPLVVGLVTNHITWGLAATFGAFAGFHGHDDPYPYRGRLLAAMGLGYVLAVMVGMLATTSPVVLVIVTSLFAGVAAFVGQALQIPPPREFMLILIALLVGSFPVPLASTAGVLGLTLAGAAWAWLVLMSGWLWDREGPERRAQHAALQTVLELLEERPPVRSGALHDAVLVSRTARRAVELANGPNAPLLREAQLELEDLLDVVTGLVIDERNVHRRAQAAAGEAQGPLAAGLGVASVTATPAAERDALSFAADQDVIDGLAADPRPRLRARARELLVRNDQALPHRGVKSGRAPAGRGALRGGLWPLRNALGRHSLVLPTALRLAIAIAVALTIGQLSGAPKPYWIAIATGAVLQGATLLTSARRAIERSFGTAIGVLFGAGIVLVEPASVGIVAGVAVFLMLGELTIAASYVVGVLFITPMTLLLSEVAAPGTLSGYFVLWRLGDTVIGCILGLLAMRLLWPKAARKRIDETVHHTLDGIARVLEHAEAGGGDGTNPERATGPDRWYRRELRVSLLNLRAVSDAGLGDRLTRSPQADRRWPVIAALSQLGYLALAERGDTVTERRAELERLTGLIRERAIQPAPEDPRRVPRAELIQPSATPAVVRPATSADLQAVEDLVERAYSPWTPQIGRRPAPMDDDYADRIARGVVFVVDGFGSGGEREPSAQARVDEAPALAGLVIVVPHADHLLIENVAVTPEAQGHGLGHDLLTHAEHAAREQGLTEVRLYTHAGMTSNLDLYARLGYRETDRRTEQDFERVFLTKTLA